jgi:hypothetical protein
LAPDIELLVTYTVRSRPSWSIKLHDGAARASTAFARFFDQVVYLPVRSSDPRDGPELQLSLFCGDTPQPRAAAIVAVPEFCDFGA